MFFPSSSLNHLAGIPFIWWLIIFPSCSWGGGNRLCLWSLVKHIPFSTFESDFLISTLKKLKKKSKKINKVPELKAFLSTQFRTDAANKLNGQVLFDQSHIDEEQIKKRRPRRCPCLPREPICAASQVFSERIQHVSHTLAATPALPRDGGPNSLIHLTVCPSNLLCLCVGLFAAGCGRAGY